MKTNYTQIETLDQRYAAAMEHHVSQHNLSVHNKQQDCPRCSRLGWLPCAGCNLAKRDGEGECLSCAAVKEIESPEHFCTIELAEVQAMIKNLDKEAQLQALCECPAVMESVDQLCYNCKAELEKIYANEDRDLGDIWEERKSKWLNLTGAQSPFLIERETMRDLEKVIDNMLKHIPATEKDFIRRLNGIKESVQFSAPERHVYYWNQCATLLRKTIPIPEKDWEKEVEKEFSGKNEEKKEEQKPRQYTLEEVREMFLRKIWTYIEYWDGLPDKSSREKLSGLSHSILVILDGGCPDIPGFIVAPNPHDDDKEYHKHHGENWFPEYRSDDYTDIAGSLHELFYNEEPKENS